MAKAYIGLGSNLHNPVAQIQLAIDAIAQLPETQLCQQSSLYGNPPMGPQDQPDYVNAVVEIATDLEPLALLDQLLQIELSQGRARKDQQWGPRTIDLDILLYAQLCMNHPRLGLPHYGLAERSFVVFPLLEIAPELTIPGRGALTVLAQQLNADELHRLTRTDGSESV